MRTVTQYRRVWACSVLVMAVGCQTTHPTALVSPQAPASSFRHSEWAPHSVIVLATSQGETKEEADFRRSLQAACRSADVDLHMGLQARVPAELEVRVVKLGKPHSSVSPAATYSDARLSCEVECFDAAGRLVTRKTLTGTGRTSQSAAAMIPLVLLAVTTADASSHVERGAMKRSALGGAIDDLAAQVVNLAANPDKASAILLERTRTMDATELTLLGVESFSLQRYAEAEFYLSEAARRFPGYQPASCYLGAAQAQLGKRDKAKRTLSLAIQIAPDTQEADQARSWLAALH